MAGQPAKQAHFWAVWVVVVATGAVMAMPDALAKKMSEKIGFTVPSLGVENLIDTILTPAGNAGASDLKSAANAVWAGALVIMLLFVVVGCVRLASGSRGAGEKLALVLGSAVLLIAAVAVFQ